MFPRTVAAMALALSFTITPCAAQTPERESQPGPFRRLFVTVFRDLKDLPSRENSTVLVNGAVLAAAAYPVDDIATLGASSSTFLKAAFSGAGKAIGREWIQGGGALAAYVAGELLDKPRLSAVAGDLIESQIVAVTTTQALKFAVSRTRPDGEARSFPSGHASSAFATARVLQRHFGPKAAIPAYAVAVYTSASRLQANSHYASDVFFGAALGIAIANTATKDLAVGRFQLAPSVTRGGGALLFVAVR
jgi:membrane-associated phospholipid phosphatase